MDSVVDDKHALSLASCFLELRPEFLSLFHDSHWMILINDEGFVEFLVCCCHDSLTVFVIFKLYYYGSGVTWEWFPNPVHPFDLRNGQSEFVGDDIHDFGFSHLLGFYGIPADSVKAQTVSSTLVVKIVFLVFCLMSLSASCSSVDLSQAAALYRQPWIVWTHSRIESQSVSCCIWIWCLFLDFPFAVHARGKIMLSHLSVWLWGSKFSYWENSQQIPKCSEEI